MTSQVMAGAQGASAWSAAGSVVPAKCVIAALRKLACLAPRTARLVKEDGALVATGKTAIDDDVVSKLIDSGRR
jgi:archaeosine-15-forming tRNA-guanine transglycosylase